MSTTKVWKAEMHKADRNDRMPSYGRFYVPTGRRTIRDAVFKYLEEAYNKASSNGKYWANARQIYYAIRPMIQNEVDADKLEQGYITGVLLKDYIEEGCGGSQTWKIAWDARGHFEEPHTKKRIGVGGIEVTEYMHDWYDWVKEESQFKVNPLIPTSGPANRFSSVLFIEKEGFNEILQDAKIGELYDMAIMSTKGMPVKAACDLLYGLPADVRIFALHDFDKSGFTILKTLRQGTRLAQGSKIIDLGLRIEDVAGLPTEEVNEKGSGGIARRHLGRCGATKEEQDFLIPVKQGYYGRWEGKRVELNAMMTDEFITWLKKKLDLHKAEKVVPEEDELAATYRHAILGQKIEAFIVAEKTRARDYKVPKFLAANVHKRLNAKPEISWDGIIWELAARRRR